MSSLGPMLDHHFAERHPGHHHLHLGSASLEHSHDFEHSHAHHDAGMYGSLATAWDGSTSAGMIFFVPNDATGSGAADLAIPPVTQPLLFRSNGDSMLAPCRLRRCSPERRTHPSAGVPSTSITPFRLPVFRPVSRTADIGADAEVHFLTVCERRVFMAMAFPQSRLAHGGVSASSGGDHRGRSGPRGAARRRLPAHSRLA